MVIDLKEVPAAKSLVFVSRAAPAANARSSPGCGVTSLTQLAAVVQLLSTPPPSQTPVPWTIVPLTVELLLAVVGSEVSAVSDAVSEKASPLVRLRGTKTVT